MMITMLKAKIHRAVVTGAEPDYVGSITIDRNLMAAAGLYEYEKVLVADVDNGNRLETYVIAGEPAGGEICLNGAAAHLVRKGDKVIIMAFCHMEETYAKDHRPVVVFVDQNNRPVEIQDMEKHGTVK